MPYIKTGLHRPCDNVHSPRLCEESSHRGHQTFGRVRFAFHGRDPFGRGCHGVAPQMHWSGSGMIGLTLEANRQTVLTHNRIHKA